MVEEEGLKVGQAYSSQRTGQKLTVLKIEGNRVYYSVEGFDPISPLFLPKEKFVHLVGLDLETP